jgi:hypothetical protein
MKLAPLLTLTLGLSCAASMAACGSSGVGEYPGLRGGGTASPVPVHSDGGNSSSSSGSSGGGSSGSSTGGGGSSSGDGGSTSFGNVTVATFTLINAAITTDPTGEPINGFDPMANETTFDLAVVGKDLSIRVDPPQVQAVGSMAFALDATFTYVADTSPYSLCGDDGKGKFNPCPLSVGKHTLTVTTYPPTIFEFTVVDSSADAGDAGTD